MDSLLLIVGLLLLFFGGHFLIETSVSISKKYNIPDIIIGLTIVAFATSLPELIVNIIALKKSSYEMVIGNVIGSNIANISLVLGLSILIQRIFLSRLTLRKIYPMLFFCTILFSVLVFLNYLNFFSGIILLMLLIVFVFFLKKEGNALKSEFDISDIHTYSSNFKIGFFFLACSLSLYFGSKLAVESAISLAEKFSVSEKFISISIIAVGTNLPEIFTSLSAIIKKKESMLMGNLLGSNIFNLLGVIGFCSIYKEINIPDFSYYMWDILAIILFTLLFYLQLKIFEEKKISKIVGVIMLTFYATYIILEFYYLSSPLSL